MTSPWTTNQSLWFQYRQMFITRSGFQNTKESMRLQFCYIQMTLHNTSQQGSQLINSMSFQRRTPQVDHLQVAWMGSNYNPFLVAVRCDDWLGMQDERSSGGLDCKEVFSSLYTYPQHNCPDSYFLEAFKINVHIVSTRLQWRHCAQEIRNGPSSQIPLWRTGASDWSDPRSL